MKRLKKIMICFILSLILQCGVLLYLDKVLFKESNEFTIENIEISTEQKEIDVEIPDSAEDMQISYNGRFITYYLNDNLMLVDTKTSETEQILEDTEILDINWVPNNNTLFVIENSSGMVNVKTYNVLNGVEQDVSELCTYVYNMEFNSYLSASAEYITILNYGETDIYRIDINDELKELDTTIEEIGSGSVFWYKDVFIYEDLYNSTFYRYTNGENETLEFANPKNLTILKTSKNMVYMGECSESTLNKSESKISKIVYGDDTKDTSTWQTIVLEKPTSSKDIYINENNEIFINDNLLGTVKNLITGESITYEGRFISMNDRVIFSLLNNKVKLTGIN